MPTLSDLLPAVEGARLVHGDPRTSVTGVTNDTRRLRPGDLFVAIPGLRVDAITLVPEAVARSASAIVAEAETPAARDVPLVVVPAARPALADFSAAFFGQPSARVPVVGITGTDGKTSTTHLLSSILEAHGLRTGWLSTVNTKIGAEVRPNTADHTTPEAPIVQAVLAEMADAPVDVAILETSSHALDLDRVRGVQYRVGVFTNLSPEHLNYHGTIEAYREAKSRLFRSLPRDGLAVLNADDENSGYMQSATAARILTYGLGDAGDLRGADVRLGPEGTRFTLLSGAAEPVRLETHLVGRFNVANWLAAYGAATYFGATLSDLEAALQRQQPVPGRMNLVRRGQPFPVVVDFAHTPQAMEKAIATVRALVQGRVLLVFGLAGGRDFYNRPVMGDLAARSADFAVFSMDDPGEEDPFAIAEQIAAGARAAGARDGDQFVIDVDRRSAIRRVLARAKQGDAVLLAGKGHEERMVLATGKAPWNDARVAGEELAELGFRG